MQAKWLFLFFAGHIATAETWVKFAKDWEELLPFAVRSKDGEFHFKMNEMAANNDRLELVGAFYRLIEQYDLLSISCKIGIQDLLSAQKRLWVLGRHIDWRPLLDPFFVTFRALIDNVHAHRHALPHFPAGEKIDFIFDNQSQKTKILPVWEEFLATRDPEVRSLFGSTPRFEDDKDFLPLQAADLWAWWVRQWYEDGCALYETDSGISMVMRGNVSSLKEHKTVFISYDEDLIVKSLVALLKGQFGDLTIYDDKYGGLTSNIWFELV